MHNVTLGVTPATSAAQAEALQTLLRNGAALNALDEDGCTPFHRACAMGSCRCAAVLLLAQCSTTIRDRSGRTGAPASSLASPQRGVHGVRARTSTETTSSCVFVRAGLELAVAEGQMEILKLMQAAEQASMEEEQLAESGGDSDTDDDREDDATEEEAAAQRIQARMRGREARRERLGSDRTHTWGVLCVCVCVFCVSLSTSYVGCITRDTARDAVILPRSELGTSVTLKLANFQRPRSHRRPNQQSRRRPA